VQKAGGQIVLSRVITVSDSKPTRGRGETHHTEFTVHPQDMWEQL
jgi:hypothetical protein